jgi:hypothetical protein
MKKINFNFQNFFQESPTKDDMTTTYWSIAASSNYNLKMSESKVSWKPETKLKV